LALRIVIEGPLAKAIIPRLPIKMNRRKKVFNFMSLTAVEFRINEVM
jgi:hypothetical protein